jgi:hypothetical protein
VLYLCCPVASFPVWSQIWLDYLSTNGVELTVSFTIDHQHEIKLRTMSWQKAAWLLAGDQVCLAIMAQTWSLS